jgi:multidrug efflux pump subunit AcrA (membrane-fusion protein)
MNQGTVSLILLVVAGLPALGGCNRTSPAEESGAADPVSLTLFTPKVELFMEYPPLVRGEPAKFVSHFTVLATGEPVRSGTLTFEGVGDGGQTVTFKADQPARDGLFTPIHAFDAPGRYRARYLLDSPQVRETVEMGELVVHANRAAAAAGSGGEAEPDPPGAVTFLMEQQWKISMLLEQVGRRTLTERIHVTAQVMPVQSASAVVSAPVSGRLLLPGSGRLPLVGDKVQRGEILGYIEPAMPATDAAQFGANQMELALRSMEIERALRQAKIRLDFATRALNRAEELRPTRVISERQYDEARQNVELARAENEAALEMKRRFDAIVGTLAGHRSVEASGPSVPSRPGEAAEPVRATQLPLRCPIDGRIVECRHVEGEQLDALQQVFRVVDLERMWVVGQVSEFDLARLPAAPGATLMLPSVPGRSFDILAEGGRMLHIGVMIDPQTRTVPIRYEIPNREGLFRGDMLADLYIETRRAIDCPAVPGEAVVMENGRPVVFVLLEGELFEKREIEMGVRDAGFVEVKGGVSEGERVVTRGAYAIKLSLLSGGFGPGHVH